MENNSFLSLFESEKEMLKEQLVGLTLPKDAEKIQRIVTDYLSKVFDGQGELRMNLTQSEDYILQAAMTLLSAQQKMVSEFASMKIEFETKPDSSITNNKSPKDSISRDNSSVVNLGRREQGAIIAGSAIGGVGGGLVLGSWGAVFGAIAGTALALYYVRNNRESSKAIPATTRINQSTTINKAIIIERAINIDSYLNIVKEICVSIDALIDTYRAQINRVINKYESQDKPVLEKDYKILLEGIQSLVGYERAHELDGKNILKLKERIEDVAESLENYNLDVVDYDGNNENLFDVVTNSKITGIQMVYPAIVKEGRVVLNGKIFKSE